MVDYFICKLITNKNLNMNKFLKFKLEVANIIIGGATIRTEVGFGAKALGATHDEHIDRNDNGKWDEGDSYRFYF